MTGVSRLPTAFCIPVHGLTMGNGFFAKCKKCKQILNMLKHNDDDDDYYY